MRRTWSNSEVHLLINLYEAEPSLYKKSHPKYSDLNHKYQVWKGILQKMKNIRPSIKLVHIKKKIYYLREKLAKSLKNPQDTSFEWAQRLNFLVSEINLKNNLENQPEETDDHLSFNSDFIEFPPDYGIHSDENRSFAREESFVFERDLPYQNPKRTRSMSGAIRESFSSSNVKEDLNNYNNKEFAYKDPMTHHFGLFVQYQLDLVDDVVKKNEIIAKLNSFLLEETTKYLVKNK